MCYLKVFSWISAVLAEEARDNSLPACCYALFQILVDSAAQVMFGFCLKHTDFYQFS